MNALPPCSIDLLQGGVYMLSFDVYYHGEVVGKVTLEKQGLYYRIQSRCVKMDGVFRLTDRCQNGNVVIGVLVPDGATMVVTKRLPIKQLGDGQHSFELLGCSEEKERFALLDEELPTECLMSLEKARLTVRDGRIGILY